MIIQATPYGTAKQEEPFAFTYSGDFTDERVDGIGDVTLNTSGTLVTSGKTVTVSVYILGGGGGGFVYDSRRYCGGGGGGNQTVTVELTQGTYEIVVGTGGSPFSYSGSSAKKASDGGTTSAFGSVSTGGGGAGTTTTALYGGAAGSPNGGTGTVGGINTQDGYGGSPNGGSNYSKGGDGLVRLTFS